MNKIFLSVILAVSGFTAVVAPMSGYAYLSPEQVFGNAPPTQREGEDVVTIQQQRASSSRAAEQRSRLRSNQADPIDTYVPDTSPQPRGLLDENASYERRLERISEEKSSGPTIVIADGTVTDGNGNVLHSGAPRVTATGPESILALTAMILAGICTFLYAQLRARRMIFSA